LIASGPSRFNCQGLKANAFAHFYPGKIMNTYLCIVCGFVYDESAGRPEDGIPPGTLWSAVAEDWACPECGVAKSDFEMVVV
jgi:rubredoxin